MRVKISQKILKKKIAEIIKLIPSKSSHAILESFKIRVIGGSIEITAYNLIIGGCIRMDASIEMDGEVCVPAIKFQKAINSLTGELTLEIAGTLLVISNSKSVLKLVTLPASNYPAISKISDPICFDVDAKDLIQSLNNTIFNVGSESTKLIFSGVNLQVNGSRVRLCATDQNSIAIADFEVVGLKSSLNITIPSVALLELLKMVSSDGGIRISANSNLICFEFLTGSLTSRLLSDKFLDYDQIIPDQFYTEFQISTSALREAIELLLVVSDQQIKVDISQSEIYLNSHSSNGVAQSRIQTQSNWTGSFYANPKSIHKLLKFSKSKSLLLKISPHLISVHSPHFLWISTLTHL
jgi:DNA polymerase III subunit beta